MTIDTANKSNDSSYSSSDKLYIDIIKTYLDILSVKETADKLENFRSEGTEGSDNREPMAE